MFWQSVPNKKELRVFRPMRIERTMQEDCGSVWSVRMTDVLGEFYPNKRNPYLSILWLLIIIGAIFSKRLTAFLTPKSVVFTSFF